jgi:hypothetical protein
MFSDGCLPSRKVRWRGEWSYFTEGAGVVKLRLVIRYANSATRVQGVPRHWLLAVAYLKTPISL